MATEKIRILYLITELGKGGAERAITDLCAEFQKREDVEFIIAPLYDDNEYEDVTATMDIRCLEYQTNSLRKKSHTESYHELIDEFKPHVIHSNRFLAEFITLERLDPNVVFVCHGHDNMIQLANFSISTLFNKEKLLNFIEKRQLVTKKYNLIKTHFISNSIHTDIYYKKVLPPQTAKNVRLIEYGFNYEKFHNPRKRTIYENKKIRISNIGSFSPKKNQKLIVDIAQELVKLNIDFEINLFGDGPLRANVEQKVKEKKLTKVVIFHGNVNDIEERLLKSDIYLHTAWYEPFGLVFLEAMASGLPIVTMDGKGNNGLVKNNYNGFFIEKEDPKIFANKIIEIIADKSFYNKLSDNGKAYCKRYDIKTKAIEFLEFYREQIRNLTN